jgi:hypothetical protein
MCLKTCKYFPLYLEAHVLNCNFFSPKGGGHFLLEVGSFVTRWDLYMG